MGRSNTTIFKFLKINLATTGRMNFRGVRVKGKGIVGDQSSTPVRYVGGLDQDSSNEDREEQKTKITI